MSSSMLCLSVRVDVWQVLGPMRYNLPTSFAFNPLLLPTIGFSTIPFVHEKACVCMYVCTCAWSTPQTSIASLSSHHATISDKIGRLCVYAAEVVQATKTSCSSSKLGKTRVNENRHPDRLYSCLWSVHVSQSTTKSQPYSQANGTHRLYPTAYTNIRTSWVNYNYDGTNIDRPSRTMMTIDGHARSLGDQPYVKFVQRISELSRTRRKHN